MRTSDFRFIRHTVTPCVLASAVVCTVPLTSSEVNAVGLQDQLARDTNATAPGEKLRGELTAIVNTVAADELIPISVVMKDQITPEAREAAQNIKSKADRREAVIRLLRNIADQSQPAVLALLDDAQAQGHADTVHSLWIANVIRANATADVIMQIANRPEVDYINWNQPIPVEDIYPVEPRDLNGGDGGEGDPGIQGLECGVDLMEADRVWNELGYTGMGVVVGHIDSGVCRTHPDIVNQIWNNDDEIPGNNIDDDNNGYIDDTWGWAFDLNSNNPDDFFGHGSHTAGTVSGDGTQGTECGMAPDSEIMALRISGSFGGEAEVWDAMQYSVDNDAGLITASLGWPHFVGPDRATWRTVCENSIAAGVVVIYAAGNEGCGSPPDNVRTPGDVPDVITVGATDCSDVLASFSSCGPVSWEGIFPWDDCPYPPGCIKPDVSAPGVNTTSHNLCSGYSQSSGTSMATPHVAGAVALMLQANPDLDHFDVKDILESTSIDLGASGKDNQFGSGRVDAFAAVTEAVALRSCMALRVENLVANETATFRVTNNIVQGDTVMLIWGTGGNGTNYNQNGYCASFDFDFDSQDQILAEGVVNANNEFVANVDMPYFWANQEIMFQAAKRDTCPDECMSHVLTRTVGGPPECMNLSVDNLVAGETATFTVTQNIVRGDYVAILWGLGGAPESINALGYCSTFWFDLPSNPNTRVVAKGYVDQNSQFVAQVNVPSRYSGLDIMFQATKRGTCPEECMSNFLDETIQ